MTDEDDIPPLLPLSFQATKVMWCPEREPSTSKDLLATTGDYLRIWNLGGPTPKQEALLNNVSYF